MPVVVITGASSGIGEATARRLGREGHRLVLAARREDRLSALAQELSGVCEVESVATDVADPDHVERLVRRAIERFGRIDVWINNAGTGQGEGEWWKLTRSEITHTLNVNLTAPVMAARAVIPRMLDQGGGHIINVASIAGHIGALPIYSASKFGLRGFSEALRRRLIPARISVSTVTPGFIRTGLTAGLKLPMPGPERVAAAIARLVRRPRREVVTPAWYRAFIWLNRLAPWAFDLVSRSRVWRSRGGTRTDF